MLVIQVQGGETQSYRRHQISSLVLSNLLLDGNVLHLCHPIWWPMCGDIGGSVASAMKELNFTFYFI